MHPVLGLLEFLDRHPTGKEEILRAQIEPLDHVLFRGVVVVAGCDRVTIDAEIGEIIEHLLDLMHIGLFIHGRIRRDLIAKDLGHFDGENAFLEHAFALDDQIVGALGVDGHTITPGYDYDAAKKDMIKRLNLRPENFFLTRGMTIEKFQKIEDWMHRYVFFGTPIYFEFLAGKRDLTCSAWAIPTRNIRGWKGPCYLMTDGHYSSYAELLEKTEWERYGVVNGVARDSRCENCMVHCGYEPSATLGLQSQRGDTWKNIRFNFGRRPKTRGNGSEIAVFNGVSCGNGHLTGKNAPAASAQAS